MTEYEILTMRAEMCKKAASEAQHMYATVPTPYQSAMRAEAKRLQAEADKVRDNA